MIVVVDDIIEERLDKRFGKKYYVCCFVSFWSGEVGYYFFIFDQQFEQFVEYDVMVFYGGQDDEVQKGICMFFCQI